MRYGVFSDVHSNLEALLAILEAYQKENIDVYLCAGDIVGYAANPLECVETIKQLVAVTVAGNHDWATVGRFSLEYFNPYAKEAILWTKGVLSAKEVHALDSLALTYKNEDLTLVHGTLNNPQDFDYLTDELMAEESFAQLETRVCFLGHTHYPGVFVRSEQGKISYNRHELTRIDHGKSYIFNVGSVGQPRDGNPQAPFCVFDRDNNEVWIKRVSYDAEAARKKIISAGLPVYLGDRLLLGR